MRRLGEEWFNATRGANAAQNSPSELLLLRTAWLRVRNSPTIDLTHQVPRRPKCPADSAPLRYHPLAQGLRYMALGTKTIS